MAPGNATAAIVTFMRAARAGRRRASGTALNALNATPLQWKLQRSEAALHAALACSATQIGRTPYLHRIEDVYFRM